MKIGLSSGFTELSAGFTVFMFNHAILRYIGEQGVVSYTIIAYVNTIVVMSMAGIAQGIQPLISFHYGRQERDVCSRLLKYSLTASVGVAGIAFLSSMAGADRLVDIFISEKLEGSDSIPPQYSGYSACRFWWWDLILQGQGILQPLSGRRSL